jgi:hypothetical protein
MPGTALSTATCIKDRLSSSEASCFSPSWETKVTLAMVNSSLHLRR